jgi:hypothetical protein|mmetsp:Transcript_98689/g.282136  ORF Transcript_98689/g.282136 Transcript_98689/m.282136 type:complete len:96 (+) Transcript_98689:106-393(+)
MQFSKSNKGSATRQRPITQSQLSALSSHLERSAPPGVIVDIKFLKEKMAAAVKGKSLPEVTTGAKPAIITPPLQAPLRSRAAASAAAAVLLAKRP